MNNPISKFENALNKSQKEIFISLNTPWDIQNLLDNIPYVGEDLNRTPLRVLQDRQCHCLDGGMLAALALSRIGFPAQIIDLVPEPGTDDDHVLAIFQKNGKFGAVAKSNYVGLRYREPIYKNLRELVMSYFEVFFNVERKKTMRGYTRPLKLAAYDSFDWQTEQRGTNLIVEKLYKLKMIPVIDSEEALALNSVDERSFQAGMLGTNPDGLFKPGSPHA